MEIERVINEAREKYEAAEFIIKERLVFLSKGTVRKAREITSVNKEKYIAQEVKRYIETNYVRKEYFKIEKAEVNEAINIAGKMIRIYNERGGGYPQKEALNKLIKVAKRYLRLLSEGER